jgi:hypothetical protein
MHIRAKTTSDFDATSTTTSAKLKAMVQAANPDIYT